MQDLAHGFHSFDLVQINRTLNQHVNALSKLAAAKDTLGRTIHMELLERPSVEEGGDGAQAVSCVSIGEDWRVPIREYLTSRKLADSPWEARKMRIVAACFSLVDNVLYKRGFSMPLLKCLGPEEARQALDEVHEGDCGEHLGGRALAAKVLRAGFFWPTLHKEAA